MIQHLSLQRARLHILWKIVTRSIKDSPQFLHVNYQPLSSILLRALSEDVINLLGLDDTFILGESVGFSAMRLAGVLAGAGVA